MTDRVTVGVVLMRTQDIELKRLADERMTSASSLIRQAVAAWSSRRKRIRHNPTGYGSMSEAQLAANEALRKRLAAHQGRKPAPSVQPPSADEVEAGTSAWPRYSVLRRLARVA